MQNNGNTVLMHFKSVDDKQYFEFSPPIIHLEQGAKPNRTEINPGIFAKVIFAVNRLAEKIGSL